MLLIIRHSLGVRWWHAPTPRARRVRTSRSKRRLDHQREVSDEAFHDIAGLGVLVAVMLIFAMSAPAAGASTCFLRRNAAPYTTSSAVTIGSSIIGATEMRFGNAGFGFGWST